MVKKKGHHIICTKTGHAPAADFYIYIYIDAAVSTRIVQIYFRPQLWHVVLKTDGNWKQPGPDLLLMNRSEPETWWRSSQNPDGLRFL